MKNLDSMDWYALGSIVGIAVAIIWAASRLH